MLDYSIFYRRPIRVDRISSELNKFDIFVSAFNSSDRINCVFADVRADRKVWLIHPEYQYSPIDFPNGQETIIPNSVDEVVQVNALLGRLGELQGKSLCIDATGFMRHVLAFLIPKLASIGLTEVTVLYSEPQAYKKQENTAFSTKTSGVVRPVRGTGGSPDPAARNVLLIGVGYDAKLISEVAAHKDGAEVYPLFAFPSLSPDMYQQSAIRAASSGEVAVPEQWITKRRFAPANDPFSTAAAVRSIVQEIDRQGAAANIYLSPLSTKVQTLGFALYWQLEGKNRGGVSILLPECITYSRETTIGLKRLWSYTIEF
ncbi:MAG: hypothetical protein RR779_09085 [Comamonas sp.]